MLDHVTANVGDLERAKGFYSQALAPLGYSLQMEFEGGAGFGAGEGMADFWLGSSSERGATHVAFSAPNRAAVDAFHEAAMGRAARTTALPASARTTTSTSTRPTCTILTATTSRRSRTGRSEDVRGFPVPSSLIPGCGKPVWLLGALADVERCPGARQ